MNSSPAVGLPLRQGPRFQPPKGPSRRTRTAILLFGLSCLDSRTVTAKLGHVSLEEFKNRIKCASIVEFVSGEDQGLASSVDKASGEGVADGIRIQLRVVRTLHEGDLDCRPSSGELGARFASEVHSSHPAEGESALFFYEFDSGVAIESIYGRSYWPLVQIQGEMFVEISWRNEFLVSEEQWLRAGGRASLPLRAGVCRVLGCDLESQILHAGLACDPSFRPIPSRISARSPSGTTIDFSTWLFGCKADLAALGQQDISAIIDLLTTLASDSEMATEPILTALPFRVQVVTEINALLPQPVVVDLFSHAFGFAEARPRRPAEGDR